MNWMHSTFRHKIQDDLSEEIRLHIEERAEHLMSEGMNPTEAARQARLAYGNRTVIEERSREVVTAGMNCHQIANSRFPRSGSQLADFVDKTLLSTCLSIESEAKANNLQLLLLCSVSTQSGRINKQRSAA